MASAAAAPGSDPQQRLVVTLFGGLSFRYAGRDIVVNNRKAKALLGYLALAPDLRDTRDRLVGLLWSETEEAHARASLRQVLRALREAFDAAGFGGFSTGRVDIALDEDKLQLDVRSVLASAGEGRPHRLLLDVPHIAETLLAGYDDVDSSFRSWLLVQRENLRQKLIRGLENRLGEAPHGLRATKEVAEALIQLDPTHEGACRQLIRCRVDLGDTAGALEAYKKLWDLLEAEYDTEPAKETQDLIAAVKKGDYTPQPIAAPAAAMAAARAAGDRRHDAAAAPPDRARAAAALPKLALAIGRFDMEGIGEEQRQVGAGFRFDLISRLVRFREWSLIDTETLSVPLQGIAVAQPLYLVSAKFFPGGSRTNFILALQAVETGLVVWSERYSLAADNFFGAQQAILHRIATVLNVNLSVERLSRLAAAPDVSLELYDRWLRGQMLLLLFRPDARPRAAKIFESITAEAPNFAPAYSSLAQLENSNHIVFAGTYRTPQSQQRALALAKTALALDPLDSRAQLCLAWAHAMNGSFDFAEVHFRQACELNEDDPWTTTSAALGFAFSDRPADARRLADWALERVPFPAPIHWGYQCQIRFVCEDYEGSVQAAERAGDAIAYLPAWRAAALAQTGRAAEAAAEIRRFLGIIEKSWYGAVAPRGEAIARWFLQCFPIRDKAARERLRSGLKEAGVPTPR